jgi:hypothetical protein
VSKKDYKRAVVLVREYVTVHRAEIATLFVRFFEVNPKFNKEKFMKACGL